MSQRFDLIVIGGGVIGVASARAWLKRYPGKTVALLEKESDLAQHTSGHNSGVIHAGYNQKPGTLKARLCVEGNNLLRSYCQTTGVAMKPTGILVVARKPSEDTILEELLRRGTANGVPGLDILSQAEVLRREPNVIGGKALWAPTGAAVDSLGLVRQLASELRAAGGQIFLNQEVKSMTQSACGFQVRTPDGFFESTQLLNCAGLHADRIAHMVGVGLGYTIVPFRGEYFKLRSELSSLVQAMIYPIPDLAFPFLGIHWTKTVQDELKIGPNAMIAFGRESYRFWDIHLKDCLEMLAKPGVWRLLFNPQFQRLAKEQLQSSLNRNAFLKEAASLVKGIKIGDFVPGPAGIRAQLVDQTGKLVDDLLIESKEGGVHVLNAVSPGLTCSLAFADYLCDQLN